MTHKCKLSIVVPMYNVEQYIEKCLRSLEDQDIDKDIYEILVIDDCSSDHSLQIITKLQKEFSNILLYQKENGGASSARNYGIKYAKGKYCWFVDSDDYIEKNILKELLYQLDTFDLDYIGFIIYDIKGKSKKNGFKGVKRPKNIISGFEYIKSYHISQSPCTHILKTEIYRRNNLYFLENIIYEDYEFVLRMYKHCHRMKFIDLSVYNYVIKENNSVTSIKSYTQSRHSLKSWFIILSSLKKYFAITNDKYSFYAQYWINNYKYIALTALLIKPLPIKEKKDIYYQYKSLGFFNIGHNHLSFKRKIRVLLYRIPFIFLSLMYLMNKKDE